MLKTRASLSLVKPEDKTLGHEMRFSLGTKLSTQNHVLAKRSCLHLKKDFYGEVMIDVMSSVHRVSFQAKCQAPILWCATNFIHLSALSKISFYS